MSYSQRVKEELLGHLSQSRHCQIAELSSIITFSGYNLHNYMEDIYLYFHTENVIVSRKSLILYKKLSGNDNLNIERMTVQALTSDLLLQKSCCKRAYLRGAFLAAGSVTNPEKSYHFEIVAYNLSDAELIKECFESFDISGKVIERKNHFVFYLKDSSLIADALNVMEAHVALMDYENEKILREMRNSVNRRVNCDMANIGKTLSAAKRQIQDIKYAMSLPAYKDLPDGVKQMAELRLAYPEASLQDLGDLCDPKVGKSGVNHRLRKVCELAENNR